MTDDRIRAINAAAEAGEITDQEASIEIDRAARAALDEERVGLMDSREPRTGLRCTCPSPKGVTTNHDNGCPLFDERAAYRQGYDDAARAASEQVAALRKALGEGVEAFRLTREYMDQGGDILPAIEGWSWFDWAEKANHILASPAPSPAREPLDVDRLALALDRLDPDLGGDLWSDAQMIYVASGTNRQQGLREWAHAIAAEYARLSDNP